MRGHSIQVNATPQGDVGKLANAVEAPTMAKDSEQRDVARGKGDNFAAMTGVHVDCDGVNAEGWVLRLSMSARPSLSAS